MLQDKSIDFTPLRDRVNNMSLEDCRIRMEQIDDMYRPFKSNAYLIEKYNQEDPIKARLIYEEYLLLALRIEKLDPYIKGQYRESGETKAAKKGIGRGRRIIKKKVEE